MIDFNTLINTCFVVFMIKYHMDKELFDMKLHELSIKRPVAVIMVILMFVVIGAYSLGMLPLEMTPEMDMSMAIVMTTYPNVGS